MLCSLLAHLGVASLLDLVSEREASSPIFRPLACELDLDMILALIAVRCGKAERRNRCFFRLGAVAALPAHVFFDYPLHILSPLVGEKFTLLGVCCTNAG